MHDINGAGTVVSSPPCRMSVGTLLVKDPGSSSMSSVFHGSKVGHGPPSNPQAPPAVTNEGVNMRPTVGSARGRLWSMSVMHCPLKIGGRDCCALALSHVSAGVP